MTLRASTLALFVSVAALSASPLLIGCAGAADRSDAPDEDGADEGALTTSAKKVVGSYELAGGGTPSFTTLVLNEDRTFSASIDTGRRCITAPCPSSQDITGTFKAGSKTITLSPNEGDDATEYHGRYKLAFTDEGISLKRSGARWTNWANELTKAAAGIWSDDVSKIEASSAGGFGPSAPPGSNCRPASQTYTFDPATRQLDWENCDTSSQPWKKKSGSRTATRAQADAITAAVKGATKSDRSVCGADKPFMEVDLTTPAATTKYVDSFYSCRGADNTYIDGIGEIFSALRDASN